MLATSSPRVRLGLAFLVAALAAVAPSSAAADPFPKTIRLPDGFQPEGIAGRGGTSLFVGSIPSGAVWAGDARTGEGAIRVPAHPGRNAIGIEVDRRDRIFVSGGETGDAYVYDARTGADLASYQLAPEGVETFVNDVVITRDAAYFTDSMQRQLYVVPLGRRGALPDQDDVRTLPLSGDFVLDPGFNLNGIESANGGRTLIVVKSPTGELFTADPKTGRTRKIDLGGETVVNGDGLLLLGRTLFVVRNRDDRVAVVQLEFNLRRGRVLTEVTDPAFDVPTTIAFAAGRLYTVNARFGNPDPTTARYDIVRLG